MLGAIVGYHEAGVALLSALAAGGGVAIYNARAKNEHEYSAAAGIAVESMKVALEQATLELARAQAAWTIEKAALEAKCTSLQRQIDRLNTKELKLRRQLEEITNGEGSTTEG